MFGLSKLVADFDSYTLDTLPRSIIIVGKEGSGKHVLTNYISSKFNLVQKDISQELSEELVDNIYRSTSLGLYLIDLRKITNNDQNILLKLFEEPPANSFITLLANNTSSILPTILNRGKIFTIENYTTEELSNFAKYKNIDINPSYFGNVIETPGDILKIYSNNINLSSIEDLVDKIINKLNLASYSNTLSILDKLNYSDEYDKIDVDFFLKLLKFKSIYSYINDHNEDALNIFNITTTDIKRLNDTRLNKKLLVTNLLTKLWVEVRHGVKWFKI